MRKLPRRHRNARVTNGVLQECRVAVTWQAPCKSEAGGEPAMVIKVPGGTQLQHGETLCGTCRHARIIRGRRMEEEVVFCDAMMMQTVRIGFKVTSCTSYTDEREPSYHELVEQAWILRPATKRREAGFVRAADLNGEEARRLFINPERD